MMARKKSRRRRPQFKGVNLVSAAETFVQANVITQGLFNTDPLAFMIGKWSSGYGNKDLSVSNSGGKVRIGIGELLGTTGNAEGNWKAVEDHFKDNWMNMLMSTALTNVGFRVGKKFLAPQRRLLNRSFKQLGLGTTIKV